MAMLARLLTCTRQVYRDSIQQNLFPALAKPLASDLSSSFASSQRHHLHDAFFHRPAHKPVHLLRSTKNHPSSDHKFAALAQAQSRRAACEKGRANALQGICMKLKFSVLATGSVTGLRNFHCRSFLNQACQSTAKKLSPPMRPLSSRPVSTHHALATFASSALQPLSTAAKKLLTSLPHLPPVRVSHIRQLSPLPNRAAQSAAASIARSPGQLSSSRAALASQGGAHGCARAPTRIRQLAAARGGVLRGQYRWFSQRHVDRQGTVHFRRRGVDKWVPDEGPGGQFSDRHGKLLAVVLFVTGGVVLVYVTHLETVPYTLRRHCVVWSPEFEKQLGEEQFKEIKAQNLHSILPAHHPEALRVRKIAADIIEAAVAGTPSSAGTQGLEKEPKYRSVHISDQSEGATSPSQKTLPRPRAKGRYFGDEEEAEEAEAEAEAGRGGERQEDPWADPEPSEPHGERLGEVAHGGRDYAEKLEEDDKWVEDNRKRALGTGSKGSLDHLKGLEWEVVVIQQPVLNAFCIPGGKLVVFTGLLEKMPSDLEIATVLGHEVGHVVARHGMERLTTGIALVALQLIVLQFVQMPQLVGTVTDLLFAKPFSRMHEIEADRIGLLLMAAAGYDPRAAPATYEKMAKLASVPQWAYYISTHPSGERRAELLRKASTMAEACRIYDEKVAERDGEGFGGWFQGGWKKAFG